MFENTQIDNEIARTAFHAARKNWDYWDADFEHNGEFASMPVLSNYPRFRGFGADYSVFRGMNEDTIEKLRIWLLRQPNPKNFNGLYSDFSTNFPGVKRISLISKLLGLWKPQQFAMWDKLARSGLKAIHNNTRGHCYSQTKEDAYAVFCKDFFFLNESMGKELLAMCRSDFWTDAPNDFGPRILDNYLMSFGKSA